MRAHELVEAVRQAGGWFEARGDHLKVKSNRGPLPDDLVDELRTHKSEIIAALSGEHLSNTKPASHLLPSGRIELSRRRDGVPADWHQGVCTLIALSCPASVRSPRWDRLQMDAAVLLETWAAQASALGWTTHDLFGVNERAPFERVDLAGLVRLLDGRKLVVLTDADAIIQCAHGGHVTFRRKWQSRQTGQVLLWQLAASNGKPESRA